MTDCSVLIFHSLRVDSCELRSIDYSRSGLEEALLLVSIAGRELGAVLSRSGYSFFPFPQEDSFSTFFQVAFL